jgi:hypothetical protein
MELDETDKKLLVFLQEDCKQTTKSCPVSWDCRLQPFMSG